MRTSGLVLGLGTAVLLAAPAWSGSELDEVEQCVRGNLPNQTSVQRVTLLAQDRAGGTRSLSGTLYWKREAQDRSKVLLKLGAPPDMRGSAYLMLEKDNREVDVFVYLPEFKRVRRISPRAMDGALFGTDFSYEDFRRFQRIASESGSQRLPDADLDGRPVYALRTTPAQDEQSRYERVDAFIDRETCVPLKLELYERGERPRKVVSVAPADVGRHGDLWIPRTITVRDVKDETETRLVVDEIEIDTEVSNHLFSLRTLARGH